MRARTARAPVVELRDEQGDPVPGASVTFQTPATGPSAAFGTEHLLVTQTGSDGRATGYGLTPNGLAGPFEIRVSASYRSEMANAIIKQVNAAPSESHSSKKILWIGLAAGAIAGGVLAATHGHGSSETPPAASTQQRYVDSRPNNFWTSEVRRSRKAMWRRYFFYFAAASMAWGQGDDFRTVPRLSSSIHKRRLCGQFPVSRDPLSPGKTWMSGFPDWKAVVAPGQNYALAVSADGTVNLSSWRRPE